jgi:hypothetical protein
MSVGRKAATWEQAWVREPIPPDFLAELRRASAAMSQANRIASEPWRSMSGALLDAIVALEELVEDSGGPAN